MERIDRRRLKREVRKFRERVCRPLEPYAPSSGAFTVTFPIFEPWQTIYREAPTWGDSKWRRLERKVMRMVRQELETS